MSGGGGDTITQENQVSPYAPSEPYLNNILTEASNLYQSGTGSQYYPGNEHNKVCKDYRIYLLINYLDHQ